MLAALAVVIGTTVTATAEKPHEGEGLAHAYPGDRGIARDEAVVAAFNFERDRWRRSLKIHSPTDSVFPVRASDRTAAFLPLKGKAVAIKVARGEHYGGSLDYYFANHKTSPEPEQMYFRYYLRFGDDWDGEGGKMPGFGGTYDRAGWGGRPSDGYNGWSARGSFGKAPEGRVRLATYCYHAQQKSRYGAVWKWDIEDRGVVEKQRWYCIEQYLKLNTPGEPDGVIRAWVEGRIAFEKTDIKFRNTPDLKIEKVWMNVFHGGKKPAASDDHVFFDNVVIASKYIGPIAQAEE